MLKKKIALLILIIILIGSFSCTQQESNFYRIGTWKTPQTIQPFFYDKFSKTKKIKVFSFTNPADQKTALLSGSLDMCGTTIAHAIHSASRGEPIVVVAALCNKCSAFVVKKDSGINKITDLKGKKIGYVPGTMHEILLRETLIKNGLSPKNDVKLVRVDFFDMGSALANGSIHAFLSGEPFPTLAKMKGYGTILAYPYYEDTIGDINAGMLVTRNTIKNNPEMVTQLVKYHIQSTKYLINNNETWLNKASSFGTALNVLQQSTKNIALTWLINEQFIKRAKALGQRMLALGIITKEPNYNTLFDTKFIKKALKLINENR